MTKPVSDDFIRGDLGTEWGNDQYAWIETTHTPLGPINFRVNRDYKCAPGCYEIIDGRVHVYDGEKWHDTGFDVSGRFCLTTHDNPVRLVVNDVEVWAVS
jgi:hypothetical protein